jgi:hypothetical protein
MEISMNEKPRIIALVNSARNYSMAPEFRADTDHTLSRAQFEGFDEAIDAMLDETMVNDRVTLREYFQMLRVGDKEGLNEIQSLNPPRFDGGEGGSTVTLTARWSDEVVTEFPDDAEYSTGLVASMQQRTVSEGLRHSIDHGYAAKELTPTDDVPKGPDNDSWTDGH